MATKHKSKKGVLKRVRVKAGGLKCRHAFRNHINGGMSAKLKRNLRNSGRYISEHFAKKLRAMI